MIIRKSQMNRFVLTESEHQETMNRIDNNAASVPVILGKELFFITNFIPLIYTNFVDKI